MKYLITINTDNIRSKFAALDTLEDIARFLVIPRDKLYYYVYKAKPHRKYRSFNIPKKSGGYRKISTPAPLLKYIQRSLNLVLQEIYQPKTVVHGFIPNRSIVTNAQSHVRQKLVFNIDIKDFFPSISYKRVVDMFTSPPCNLSFDIAQIIATLCCFDNQLPQGAPTSSVISNMICDRLDTQLQALAGKHQYTYTRYADDITFSTHKRAFHTSITQIMEQGDVQVGNLLEQIIFQNGFVVNPDKVRLQRATQRQEVTGITVNEFPNVQRKLVRQVRAMLHAWDKFNLTRAADEYARKYASNKIKQSKEKMFKQIVRGKIDYIGMVKGKDDLVYLRLRSQFETLCQRSN